MTKNTTAAVRTATVTITSGDKKLVITITQELGGKIIVDGETTYDIISTNVSPIQVTFSSSKDWSVAFSDPAPDTWQLSKTSGSAGQTESFTITPAVNASDEDKTVTVNITSEGEGSQDITINQSKQAKITLTDPTDANLTLPSVALDKTINLTSARPWTVDITESNTQDWFSITDETNKEGGANSSFKINATANTGAEKIVTITITSEGVEQEIKVTQQPTTLTINSVKWAIGNVTCGNVECTTLKIADSPYERGLYFQWYGGDSGENTVIGYAKGGNETMHSDGADWDATPRYVQPNKAGFPSIYPAYHEFLGGVYHSSLTEKGEWTANNPCTLVEGGGWRLPTHAELWVTHPEQRPGFSKEGWTYSRRNGGYFQHTASGLIFPLAGFRSSGDGWVGSQGSDGYYWSSSEYSSYEARRLRFHSSSGYGLIVTTSNKATGFSVRCVQN